jgi:hypothetical protein
MSVRQRWLGIAGIVFVVLVVVSIFVVPNPPGTHASVTKIVSYYHDHKAGQRASAYLTELAVFLGVGFFWYLREYLIALDPASKRSATLGFAGALIFAVSGATASGISWALADGVDHIGPSAMQTLNVLNMDLTGFIGAPGIALFLAATGGTIIVHRMLPTWLGWAGIVLAVVALVIGFFGLLGVGLWILAASIVILLRPDRAAPAAN